MIKHLVKYQAKVFAIAIAVVAFTLGVFGFIRLYLSGLVGTEKVVPEFDTFMLNWTPGLLTVLAVCAVLYVLVALALFLVERRRTRSARRG